MPHLIPENFEVYSADHIFQIDSQLLNAELFGLYNLITDRKSYQTAITDFVMQDTSWGYTEINVLMIDLNQDHDLYEVLPLRTFIHKAVIQHPAEVSTWQEEEMDLKRQEDNIKQQQRILQFRQFVHSLANQV